MKKITTRNSNIELLRIISVILIIGSHLIRRYEDPSTLSLANMQWYYFLTGGLFAVNIFLLISGYFLIDEKEFKINKIIKIILMAFFYSNALIIIRIVFNMNYFDLKGIIHNIFPITFNRWYFVNNYLILYILFPFINKLIHSLKKNEFRGLIIILSVVLCIIPTLTATSYYSNNIVWFIFMYLIGAYIKLYIDPKKYKHFILYAIGLYILTLGVSLISSIAVDKYSLSGYWAKLPVYLLNLKKLPFLIVSILLFIGFLNINIKENKIINKIATASLGVYMVHRLFIDLFYKESYYSTNIFAFIGLSILFILIVYILSVIVDLIREEIHKRLLSKHIDNLSNKIKTRISS